MSTWLPDLHSPVRQVKTSGALNFTATITPMRVLVFGDSIAQGFWDSEGGWAARLRRYYDELEINDFKNSYPTIFNLGVSGDATKDVRKRLEPETKARLWPTEEIAYIFAIGLNDTVYRGQEFESKPEKYRQELTEILAIAKNYSKKILFVGLTPVVDSRVQPLQWSASGKCYSNERIIKFEDALKSFCAENKVAYVPVFEKLKQGQDRKEMMPDGAHPNNEGHELIYQLVKPELDKLLHN